VSEDTAITNYAVFTVFSKLLSGKYMSTKASGYLHDIADVSVRILNKMVGSLVPIFTTLALVAAPLCE
jgi:hypothetical protein